MAEISIKIVKSHKLLVLEKWSCDSSRTMKTPCTEISIVVHRWNKKGVISYSIKHVIINKNNYIVYDK